MMRKTVTKGRNVYWNYWRTVNRTYEKPLNKIYNNKETPVNEVENNTYTLRNTVVLGASVILSTTLILLSYIYFYK